MEVTAKSFLVFNQTFLIDPYDSFTFGVSLQSDSLVGILPTDSHSIKFPDNVQTPKLTPPSSKDSIPGNTGPTLILPTSVETTKPLPNSKDLISKEAVLLLLLTTLLIATLLAWLFKKKSYGIRGNQKLTREKLSNICPIDYFQMKF